MTERETKRQKCFWEETNWKSFCGWWDNKNGIYDLTDWGSFLGAFQISQSEACGGESQSVGGASKVGSCGGKTPVIGGGKAG